MSRATYTRALVTGASSGIGEELARQLAGRGCHLVLVARRGERLETLATELADQHGVRTEVLVADLTDDDQLATVADRLVDERAPIDLLINNAGLGSVGRFAKTDPAWLQAQIDLNIASLVRLTRTAIPGMVEAGHGGVLHVSSLGGFQPVPGMAVYAATKAFVTSFSQAIHEEVRDAGVHVTALCPGFTRTEFVDRVGARKAAAGSPGMLWSETPAVAATGIDGVVRGRAVVVPGGLNAVAAAFSQVSPAALTRRVAGGAFGRMGR